MLKQQKEKLKQYLLEKEEAETNILFTIFFLIKRKIFSSLNNCKCDGVLF